jgi:hypothetical protein
MLRAASALIVAAGLFNFALAVFHLSFWRQFHWQDELPRLGVVNRGIMQVLNLCLTYVFIVAAVLLLLFPLEAFATELGTFLLLAMAGFWLLRAILQPMYFQLRHSLSQGLFAIFVVGTLIHGAAWWLMRDI